MGGDTVRAQKIYNGGVNSLSFSSYNEILLSVALSDGSISFLDLRQFETPLISLRGHEEAIRQVCFSPYDKTLLVSGGEDGRVCIWDFNRSKKQNKKETDSNPKLLLVHPGHTSVVND